MDRGSEAEATKNLSTSSNSNSISDISAYIGEKNDDSFEELDNLEKTDVFEQDVYDALFAAGYDVLGCEAFPTGERLSPSWLKYTFFVFRSH